MSNTFSDKKSGSSASILTDLKNQEDSITIPFMLATSELIVKEEEFDMETALLLEYVFELEEIRRRELLNKYRVEEDEKAAVMDKKELPKEIELEKEWVQRIIADIKKSYFNLESKQDNPTHDLQNLEKFKRNLFALEQQQPRQLFIQELIRLYEKRLLEVINENKKIKISSLQLTKSDYNEYAKRFNGIWASRHHHLQRIIGLILKNVFSEHPGLVNNASEHLKFLKDSLEYINLPDNKHYNFLKCSSTTSPAKKFS